MFDQGAANQIPGAWLQCEVSCISGYQDKIETGMADNYRSTEAICQKDAHIEGL